MLKQKFATQFGTSAIVKLITMVAGFVVARFAGPSVLGTVSFGTSYVSIWLFITSIFAAGHMKLVSEGRDHGDCVATYVWLKTISVVLYIIAVLSWLAYQVYIKHVVFEAKDQILVIMLALASAVIMQLYHVISNSYTAMLMQAKANLPHVIHTAILHIGRIIVVVFGAKAVGLSLWQLVALIIVMPLLIKYFRDLPFGGVDKQLLKQYLHYGLPTLLLTAIHSILQFSDKLILAHYTSVEELGYYAAAMSIGGTLLVLSNSIGTIFFPLFSKLIKNNEWEEVNRKNKIYQEFNTVFLLPFTILIALIAEPLLVNVLGARYQPSVMPFRVIILSTYLVIVGMPYGNIITGMGRFYANVWINASQLIIFIVSITFFLSPKFLNLGATGLAFNLMITYLYRNGAYIIVSRKLGSLKYDKVNLIRTVCIIVLGFVLGFLALMISKLIHWWWIVFPLGYLAIMYATLFALRLVTKEHLSELLELLNIKKTSKYIRNEIGR